MRTIKKINIIVLLLTTLLWSTIPSGLILAAENGEISQPSKADIVQLETPVEILPNESELIPESVPDELTPVTPIEPIIPIKPIIPNDELIPELTPTDHKLVPDDEEREPRNPLDEENPVDEAAKRDNAGLQPKNNGQYSVDEFTGVFSYDYPLQIPAGRNGLQPSVSLQYNHRLNNIGSAVGVGWQLTMPSIERSNRTGLNNLYTDNYFRLNLAGSDDLVAIDVDANGYGTYGKQIESDFLKVEFASTSNAWIVTDKLGTVYTFGATIASRQDNPADNTQIYKWLLNEVRDTNDNFVRYEYYKDSGQIYPKKIFYTGHGTTDGIFEVDFEPFANGNPVENNIDNISYQTGFGVETKYLLDSVDIKISGQLVTSYDLILNLNANDNKYLLDGIIPRFYQDGNYFVKDQVEFDYSESINTYKEGEGYDLPYALGSNPGTFNSKRDMFMDLNGDSYTDYLRLFCSNGNVSLSVWLNDANGHWSTSTPYAVAQAETGITCAAMYGTRYTLPISFGNINGDHFIDMVTEDTVYYNTGAGWQTDDITLPIGLYYSSGQNQAPLPEVFFQDMNTDGYDDIVRVHHPNNHQSDVDVYIKDQATGTWNLDNNFHLSVDQPSWECLVYGGSPFDFKDFNNDGLLDVFYNYYCRYNLVDPIAQAEGVYLNSGNNFSITTLYSAPVMISYYYLGTNQSGHLDYFTDLNNDNIQDYGIYSRSEAFLGGDWFGSGALTLSDQQIFSTGWSQPRAYYTGPLPVAIADINGDQIQDVIHNPSYFDIYYGQGIKPDILTEVDYQSGAKVNVYYNSSTKEKDEQGNLLNSDLPFDLQIVKEVVVNNGQQEWQGYQYQYEDGQTVSYLEDNIKDLYGFAKVEKKLGKAMPDIDFGTGVDGAYVSSGNETWTTDKNFTSLNIQSGHTITVEPNVIIKVQGDVVIDGILDAKGKGYDGAGQNSSGGFPGHGPGGGGGAYGGVPGISTGGGGGAGYAQVGETGHGCPVGYCTGGPVYGNELLDGIDKGSGGGGASDLGDLQGGWGADGGGIVRLFARNITVNGEINADGNNGYDGQSNANQHAGGGGGGSGGSVYLKAFESVDITGSVHANGGQGGQAGYNNNGGDGSDGRIRIESPVINGNTNPSYYSRGDFDYSIDNTPADNNLQKQINYYHTAIEDGLHLHGRPKMTEKYDSSNNLIAKSFNSWQEEDLNNDRKFVYTATSVQMDLTTTTSVSTAKQYTHDLTNGNLLTEEDLGQVELDINTGQIINELIGDEKLITHEYAFNSTEHILAAPKTKIISDDSDSKQQNLYYDNLPLGQVNSVNLTKEDYIVNQVDIDRTFNNYGLVTTQTDPKGFNTTLAYDGNYLYPTQATNPLNQITYTQYNLFNGQVATSTAPNGLITVNKYDAFGRLTETKVSNPDNPAQLVTKQELIYGEVINPEMYSTFWATPSSHGQHYNLFSDPQNGYLTDGYYATRQDGGAPAGVNQSYESFDVDIPSDAIISGVQISVNHKVDNTNNITEWATYYSPSAGSWSEPINLTVSTNNHEDIVGSQNFLDVNLTAEDILNGNFSVAYFGARSTQGNTTWYLDGIKVKFYYEEGIRYIRYVETHNYFDINTYQTSREYYNGLNQVIQKKSQMADENQWSTIDIAYDALGRVIRQSLPYVTATVDYTEPDLEQPSKIYTYDALDRILTENTPTGTTTYEYDGLTTKIYDANNHRKDLTKDAYGNLVEVKEYNNGEIYTTSYEYNLSNQITKIIDALGNVRNFTYDALGNLISQDMVHVPGAEHVPAMTYTYDKNGNVASKRNFNSQLTTYAYDQLNRVIKEKTGGPQDITYIYDQGVVNRGQLTQVKYGNGNQQNYSYDILGRQTDYDALIEGQTYNTDYDYNLSGQLTEVIYPDGKQVNYDLNNIGQLNEVLYDDGQNISTLASQFAYNANGQLVGLTRSNGFSTNYTYLPEDNYRLINLTTTDGQETLQDIDYVYDPIGNITELTDNGQADLAKTVNYAYDDLNRLLSAEADYLNNTTSDYSITYEYDAIGNMTYNSELGDLEYNYYQPHQVSEANNITYTYDNAGNLLDNEITDFTWDYRNRLIGSLDASLYPVYYSYDYNNQRLVKTQYKDNGQGGIGTLLSQNHYVDKYFEKDLVNDNTKAHIYLGSIKLATVNDSNDPYFIVGDHLNSSSILVDNSGNLAEVTDYDPYGKINYENGSINDDYGFTGKILDSETDLQYYGARYLDNGLGRFVSVDPLLLDLNNSDEYNKHLLELLSDPQQLHSYSYARNNPIVYTDLTGNAVETPFDMIMLALSAQMFYSNPSVGNGVWLGLDTLGTLVPGLPAASYLRSTRMGYKIFKYFDEVAEVANKKTLEVAKTFAQNIAFKFNRRAWSAGEAGNDVASLTGHFVKWGDSVGAKDVGDYYNKANDFIENKQYTQVFKEGYDKVYYNRNNKYVTITGSKGEIKSYHLETNPNKISNYEARIRKGNYE